MFEDVYFWSKNGRPDIEKDQDCNTACHYKLRHLKTEGVILKTYHLDFGEGQCVKRVQEELDRTVFHQDIAPYVRYSVNKKKRWEVDRGGIELLGELQKMYCDMEVAILERVHIRSAPYIAPIRFHDYYFSSFPIQRIHKLQDDNSYQCISVNSVYGQKIQHFSSENRSPTQKSKLNDLKFSPKVARKPKVAYHFISPPKNYEVFLQKRFQRKKGRIWWWPLEYVKADYSQQISEDTYEAITYDRVEDLEWDEVHEWDEDDVEEVGNHPKKFYNFEDHIVEKFVFVKRKKTL